MLHATTPALLPNDTLCAKPSAALLPGQGRIAVAQHAGRSVLVGRAAASPLTPGPAVSDVRTFEQFAEIGVVLLMFSIGIEFSLKDLLRVRWVAILGGPLGMLHAYSDKFKAMGLPEDQIHFEEFNFR